MKKRTVALVGLGIGTAVFGTLAAVACRALSKAAPSNDEEEFEPSEPMDFDYANDWQQTLNSEEPAE